MNVLRTIQRYCKHILIRQLNGQCRDLIDPFSCEGARSTFFKKVVKTMDAVVIVIVVVAVAVATGGAGEWSDCVCLAKGK